MARGKAKPHHRADTRGGGFTGLPHVVQDSEAFRHPSMTGRAVLFEIVRVFNGHNNGEIGVSVSKMCENLNTQNRGKVCKAIAELMQHGLIDVAAEAQWRERQAREYRLTFVASGKFPNIRQASNEYRSWSPQKKSGGEASSPEKPKSGEASSPEAVKAGETGSPAKFEKLRKTAKSGLLAAALAGEDASLHILQPYPSPKTGGANPLKPRLKQAQNSGGRFAASLPTPCAGTLARVLEAAA